MTKNLSSGLSVFSAEKGVVLGMAEEVVELDLSLVKPIPAKKEAEAIRRERKIRAEVGRVMAEKFFLVEVFLIIRKLYIS